MKQRTSVILLASSVLATSLAFAQAPSSDRDSLSTDTHAQQPDNSRNNANASNRNASADQQGNGKQDVAMTAQIRRDVMSDRDLSTYAHNVKIVSSNGTITMNGVVKSADEKAAIHRHAANVAGESKVVDHLKVKGE